MDLNPLMPWANRRLVMHIERSEACSLAAIVTSCGREAFAVPIGSGFALFNGPDSPFSKVAGLGFEPLDLRALSGLEERYRAHGAPIQIELSTQADAELTNLLARRGYRLSGFENVLGSRLGPGPGGLPEARQLGVRRAR